MGYRDTELPSLCILRLRPEDLELYELIGDPAGWGWGCELKKCRTFPLVNV